MPSTSPRLTKRWGLTSRARSRALVSRGRSLMPPVTRAAWMGRRDSGFGFGSSCVLSVFSRVSSLPSPEVSSFSRSSASICSASDVSFSMPYLSSYLSFSSTPGLSSIVGNGAGDAPRSSLRGARPCTTSRRGSSCRSVMIFSSMGAVMEFTPWDSRRLRAATL